MANILVVAAYNAELDELKTILKTEGHEVTLTNSWTETIRILSAQAFDLVIFKLELGLPMFKAIQEKQPSIPSILLYGKEGRPEQHTANLAIPWPTKSIKLLGYVTTVTRNLQM